MTTYKKQQTIADLEKERDRWFDSYINADDYNGAGSALEKAYYKRELDRANKQLSEMKSAEAKKQQDAKNRQSLVNLKNAVTSKLPQVPEDLQLYWQGVMNAAKGAYNVERQNQWIREVMQAYNDLAEINNIYADLNTWKTRLWWNQDISMKRFQDAAKNYQEMLRKNKSNLPDNLVQQLSSAVPYQIVNTGTRDYYPAINYNILDNWKQYFTNSLQDLWTNMNAYKNAKQNFQQNSNIYNSNPSVETLQNKDESRNNLAKARRNLWKLGL